ncbi:MAG: hypothetical protein GF419_12575 [Ignavibacteriales bacterium]|nr:hypothetical protein [Ignavibacteriales bacterium]
MKGFLLVITFIVLVGTLQAQSPGKTFGFGLIVGDPTGGTIKLWTGGTNAIAAHVGGSYFGEIRIGADYLWHFNAFNSRMFNLHAGVGGAIGLGDGGGPLHDANSDNFYNRGDDAGVGIGGRGVVGVNFYTPGAPVEIFLEVGPFIGIVPDVGFAFDGALGARYYP